MVPKHVGAFLSKFLLGELIVMGRVVCQEQP